MKKILGRLENLRRVRHEIERAMRRVKEATSKASKVFSKGEEQASISPGTHRRLRESVELFVGSSFQTSHIITPTSRNLTDYLPYMESVLLEIASDINECTPRGSMLNSLALIINAYAVMYHISLNEEEGGLDSKELSRYLSKVIMKSDGGNINIFFKEGAIGNEVEIGVIPDSLNLDPGERFLHIRESVIRYLDDQIELYPFPASLIRIQLAKRMRGRCENIDYPIISSGEDIISAIEYIILFHENGGGKI